MKSNAIMYDTLILLQANFITVFFHNNNSPYITRQLNNTVTFTFSFCKSTQPSKILSVNNKKVQT